MSILPASFGTYVEHLEQLPFSGPSTAELRPHLDGEVNRRLRDTVELADLRTVGAFFTGESLADRLVARVPRCYVRWADPACGCGDLLMAASWRLQVSRSLEDTLRAWNDSLIGRDTIEEFAAAARARVVLAAVARGARPSSRCPRCPADLLTNIQVGDGRELRYAGETAIVLNPPYGRIVAPPNCEWATGLTTEAALFLDCVVDRARDGAFLAAVLPEVIRAGSRYERLRERLAKRIGLTAVEPAGVFDALTDVDVFVLAGEIGSSASAATWPLPPDGRSLSDICEVRVGTVVANRDPHKGPWRPFLDARSLGAGRTVTPIRSRRFRGTVFTPPFVVVARTNRPALDGRPRLRPVIVSADRPVAIENHLIALLPHESTLKACEDIARLLATAATTTYLDARLRCRHLTVQAMREISP